MEVGSKGHLNQKALFCDETEEYRIPAEPDAGRAAGYEEGIFR